MSPIYDNCRKFLSKLTYVKGVSGYNQHISISGKDGQLYVVNVVRTLRRNL